MRRCLIIAIASMLLVGMSTSSGSVSLPRLVACYLQNDRDPTDGMLEFVAECMTGTDLDRDGRAPHDPATDYRYHCQVTVVDKEHPCAVRITGLCREVKHIVHFIGGPLGGFATRVWQPPQV